MLIHTASYSLRWNHCAVMVMYNHSLANNTYSRTHTYDLCRQSHTGRQICTLCSLDPCPQVYPLGSAHHRKEQLRGPVVAWHWRVWGRNGWPCLWGLEPWEHLSFSPEATTSSRGLHPWGTRQPDYGACYPSFLGTSLMEEEVIGATSNSGDVQVPCVLQSCCSSAPVLWRWERRVKLTSQPQVEWPGDPRFTAVASGANPPLTSPLTVTSWWLLVGCVECGRNCSPGDCGNHNYYQRSQFVELCLWERLYLCATPFVHELGCVSQCAAASVSVWVPDLWECFFNKEYFFF